MNKSIIRYILCKVVQFEGFFLLLPAVVALFYSEKQGFVYLGMGVVLIVAGIIGSAFKPANKSFYAREGFVAVSLSWILLSLLGAVPFVLTKDIPNYIDALFETVSGFTTTGASILSNVEAMSMTSMFWRCFTNWIGGMGVLVFIMAVLPLSGSHNMNLLKAESTGPEVGKLVPKVKSTATILYSIYLGLTIIQIVCYLCVGEGLYDALVLSFSTMGTGGFARFNASLGAYSKAVRVISLIFMILCGINFNAYFLILVRKFKELFKLEEVRMYLLILFAGAVAIFFYVKPLYTSGGEAFFDSLFQITSIMTTTGFATTDFDIWPMFPKMILLCVMVIGGCAGSTSGGIKVSRVMLLRRNLHRELSYLAHPRSVKRVRMNGTSVSEDTLRSVNHFMVAYIVLLVLSGLLVSIDNFDFTTTFTGVLSMLGNVGPGLSMVGPTGNYGAFSEFSKVILSLDMLAGRLEIYPILMLTYVGTWRKS